MSKINTIIFDLGNVLVDWNPMHVYRDYFDSEEKRDYFFKNICTAEWNEEQDEGKSIVEATQYLVKKFPDWEKPIRDYYGRWTEMLKGPIHETVDIFRELKDSGEPFPGTSESESRDLGQEGLLGQSRTCAYQVPSCIVANQFLRLFKPRAKVSETSSSFALCIAGNHFKGSGRVCSPLL